VITNIYLFVIMS